VERHRAALKQGTPESAAVLVQAEENLRQLELITEHIAGELEAVQEQLAEMIGLNNSVAGIETLEQLWFRKGELAQMLWLQTHQATHEAAYNELLAQQDGGEAEATTGGVARVIDPDTDYMK